MTYEEYLEKYADAEYNTETKGCPTHIVRTPNRELICYPRPDKAYEMVYEYYRTGYDLDCVPQTYPQYQSNIGSVLLMVQCIMRISFEEIQLDGRYAA